MARAKRQKLGGNHPNIYYRDTSRGRLYDFHYYENGKKKWGRADSDLRRVEKELAARRYEAKFGRPIESAPPTLGAYIDKDWEPHTQARVLQGTLSSTTLKQYQADIRKHLRPTFGDTRLDAIDVAAVERFQSKLTNTGQSNHSVRRLINTLSGILEHARRRRLIQFNPCQAVDKPRATAKRKPILPTVEQVYELAHGAPTPDDRRFILTLAFTGVRKSELFALRWPNVVLDDEGGVIRVVERCYEGDVADRTKTQTGSREIPLGAIAIAILREQAANGRVSPHNLVFPSPNGAYWLGQNFHKRVWKDTRTQASLPRLTLHDLRHFYTTLMRGQGLPTSVTEQLLGHADDRTHRGYTQPRAEDAKLVREASDRAFRREAA
jgi:integrase